MRKGWASPRAAIGRRLGRDNDLLFALPFADHISNHYADHDNYDATEHLPDEI